MSHIQAPVVSVIIPVFNKWEYTFKCLMAVAANTGDVAHEVIVVDNASSDDTAQALPLLDGIRFQRNEKNFGFARACNQGAAMARGKYLMFLNNDTEVRARWLSSMVHILDGEPDVAMVGSKLLFPDGTLQHGGVVFAYAGPLPVTPFHLHYRRPESESRQRKTMRAVTAACMLIRGEVFRAVGTFDEGYINGYEDVDLCLKVSQTGAKIVYTPDSVAVHYESVSEGRFNADSINVNRLNERWQGRFKAFDVDFRREVQPMAVDPARAAASVIVPMRDALWSLAPCLENLRYTTGAQDEVIIVDDGSLGPAGDFARQFVAAYPQRFRLIRNPAPTSLAQATLQGLEAATRPRVAVMAPSMRVVTDWLARLSAHFDAQPKLGVVVPTLLPVEGLPTHQLYYPLEQAPPDAGGKVASGVAHPRAANPGDVEEVAIAATMLAYGPRERLLEIGRRVPEALLGDDRGRLSVELRAHGLALGRARDVGVYRLVQIPGDVDGALVATYARAIQQQHHLRALVSRERRARPGAREQRADRAHQHRDRRARQSKRHGRLRGVDPGAHPPFIRDCAGRQRVVLVLVPRLRRPGGAAARASACTSPGCAMSATSATRRRATRGWRRRAASTWSSCTTTWSSRPTGSGSNWR